MTRVVAIILFFSLIFHSLFIIPSSVYAASSSWTQTDWSGGVGASTTNQYSAGSSVDATTTSGQVTLTNTEKFSNTSFESDLSSWNSFSATGGTITTSGGYTIHTFTNSGTFTPNSSSNVEYLVVAGGGGGGGGTGGGGGAGGFRTGIGHSVTAQAYTITVGSGGAGGTNTNIAGSDGGNSVFDTIISIGGGGGGSNNTAGHNGGSGGGSGHDNVTGGLGTTGQGNDGGDGGPDAPNYPGSGGGGAGAVGQNTPSTTVAGNGGNGLASSISGSSVTYAGGGGGGTYSTGGTNGTGGTGGGGGATVAGTANTGGGGGGATNNTSNSGAGGSGIVIVRYATLTTTRDTSTTYNSSAGSAKLVSGSDVQNFTQTVNVGDTNTYNLVAYARTDGSAVTSSDVELFYNGSTISTTYTSVGSGWYKLTGTLTGANASRVYGVQVKANKTVYVDDFSLNNYASSGTLTSSIFDTEFSAGAAWETLTYTSSGSTVAVKARTSNSLSMTGATDFSSCTAITSSSDISSNSCVTDSHRYIQYQLSLSTSDTSLTPTFSDISLAFATYDDTGPTLNLDSPGDNSYTNSERPIFKWKQATDAVSTVADYDLTVDNGESGDFTITDIPTSRTSDYETNKYVVKYDGFSDSDSDDNYISVYTKSSSDWGTSENDGKLKEGKRSWAVKATDSVGNSTTNTRILFVDRTDPSVEFTQVNSTLGSTSSNSNFSTTSKKPTIFGKITDILAGEQKAASGAKNVEIKLEKKNALGGYELHTLTTLNFNENYFISDNLKITDNSKQTSDKYVPFEYIPKEDLTLGTYRVTITGKDNADNASSAVSFTLNITTLDKLTTLEEKKVIEEEILKQVQDDDLNEEQKEQIKQELEITKPTGEVPTSALEKLGNNITKTTSVIASVAWQSLTDITNKIASSVNFLAMTIGDVFNTVGSGIAFAYNTVNSINAFVNDKTFQGLAFIFNKTGEVLTFVSSINTSVNETIFHSIEIATSAIGNGLYAVTNNIGQGYSNIANNAPGISKNILLAVGNGVSTVGTGIGNGFGAVGTTSNNIADGTSSVIASVNEAISNTGKIATSAIGNGFLAMTNGVKNGIANIAFAIGVKTEDVSHEVGTAVIKFGYLFVPEPTKIYDVKVIVLSPTSAKVSWETNHPANGKVNYGLDETYPFDIQTEKRTNDHEFTLTNLEPDTEYHFEVMSQNRNYVYDANRKFRTPLSTKR